MHSFIDAPSYLIFNSIERLIYKRANTKQSPPNNFITSSIN